MPTGPVPPSAKKVQELAESFGFTMSDADADLYSEMMAGTLNSYRRLDTMQETKPPVKYPRCGSYRPGPEEDPYNAWFVKGEIKGAGGRRACRQAGRHQGCDLRRGLPHDQRRQGDGGLYPRHRRHRGDARARCGRDHPRQDQQRGLLVLGRQPHLGLWARAQPAQADPFDRRVVQTATAPPSRPAISTCRSAATRAARSAFPRAGAASSATSLRMASCPIPAP